MVHINVRYKWPHNSYCDLCSNLFYSCSQYIDNPFNMPRKYWIMLKSIISPSCILVMK